MLTPLNPMSSINPTYFLGDFPNVAKKLRFLKIRRMTKSDLIRLAGSQRELARILGISFPAVCQWKEQIPELRLRQLRDLKPEWFAQG